MNTIEALNKAFKAWNVELISTIIGLLLIPFGYIITYFDLYMTFVVPLKAKSHVYASMDISTLIAEFFIISLAAILALLTIKVSKLNCEATLDKAKEMIEKLDMKNQAIEITRFVDKTLALAEETSNSYNKLLHIVKKNKTKDVDIFDLTKSAIMRWRSAQHLKNEIQKSRDLIEKNISNLNSA